MYCSFCRPILNKPKPKPKASEKVPAETTKKDEAKEVPETNGETIAPEVQEPGENKKDPDMDID